MRLKRNRAEPCRVSFVLCCTSALVCAVLGGDSRALIARKQQGSLHSRHPARTTGQASSRSRRPSTNTLREATRCLQPLKSIPLSTTAGCRTVALVAASPFPLACYTKWPAMGWDDDELSSQMEAALQAAESEFQRCNGASGSGTARACSTPIQAAQAVQMAAAAAAATTTIIPRTTTTTAVQRAAQQGTSPSVLASGQAQAAAPPARRRRQLPASLLGGAPPSGPSSRAAGQGTIGNTAARAELGDENLPPAAFPGRLRYAFTAPEVEGLCQRVLGCGIEAVGFDIEVRRASILLLAACRTRPRQWKCSSHAAGLTAFNCCASADHKPAAVLAMLPAVVGDVPSWGDPSESCAHPALLPASAANNRASGAGATAVRVPAAAHRAQRHHTAPAPPAVQRGVLGGRTGCVGRQLCCACPPTCLPLPAQPIPQPRSPLKPAPPLALLAAQAVSKVGVGAHGDALKVCRDFGFEMRGVVCLSDYANDRLVSAPPAAAPAQQAAGADTTACAAAAGVTTAPDSSRRSAAPSPHLLPAPRKWSLAALAGHLMRLRVEKSQRLRCSNWSGARAWGCPAQTEELQGCRRGPQCQRARAHPLRLRTHMALPKQRF